MSDTPLRDRITALGVDDTRRMSIKEWAVKVEDLLTSPADRRARAQEQAHVQEFTDTLELPR